VVITEFIGAYNGERKRLKKEANAQRTRTERRRGETEREITRAVDAITKGAPPEPIIPRMRELEIERKMLSERLEAAKEADNVIALHPKAIDRYKRAVTELADELKRGEPMEFATIRELVTAIIAHASPSRPGGAGTKTNAEDDRSVRIDIKGRLAQLCDNPALFPNVAMSGPLVAGEGRATTSILNGIL
jgi:site-specific DNA recombinase